MREVAARNLEDQQVAEMIQQVGKQPAKVLAVCARSFEWRSAVSISPARTARDKFEQLALRGQAEHREHVGFLDFVAAKADELVERGFGVAHAAFGAAGDRVQRGVIDLHLFLARRSPRGASTISAAGMRRRSKRWQRERIVGRTFSGSVVANMNFTCAGGSSSVLSSALNAAVESM